MAIRGVTASGNLHLPRDVIRHTIRRHAEDICTEQLGFRTVNDAIESERREVNALHFTGLDREIQKRMTPTNEEFAELELQSATGAEHSQFHGHHLAGRLHFLTKLDLGEPHAQNRWRVTQDLHQKLRGLQRQNDRQRSLADKAGLYTKTADDRQR